MAKKQAGRGQITNYQNDTILKSKQRIAKYKKNNRHVIGDKNNKDDEHDEHDKFISLKRFILSQYRTAKANSLTAHDGMQEQIDHLISIELKKILQEIERIEKEN